MSHTKTPWIYKDRVIKSSNFGGWHAFVQDDGRETSILKVIGTDKDTVRTNAAHIVRCVNSHEALVQALEKSIETIKMWHSIHSGGVKGQAEYIWKLYQSSPEMKIILAALAAAKENQK